MKQVPWSASIVKKENWILWKQSGKELGSHIQTMLWGWHFKNVFALYSNLWYFHQSEGMTYGTEATQWDGGGVRCKWLEETQRLQSGSPYTSSLSPLRLGGAVIYGVPLLEQAAELSTILKRMRGRRRPRKITCVTQGLRLAKRWNWDSNSTWTFCCFWIQFPTDIIQILFLSCWSQRGRWQNVECLLSTFQRFTDGVSLEQFSTNKGLLLKGALSFCLYYCCCCLFSLIPNTAPIISDCLFFMRWTPRWKIRKHYFLKTSSFLQAAAQVCLTLCNLMDSSPPGSSVLGDSPGKNTGMGCHALLRGILPT